MITPPTIVRARAELLEAECRGLIPDFGTRHSTWDATDYKIAGDFLDDHGLTIAGESLRNFGFMREGKTA
jgi:hypothetical protein